MNAGFGFAACVPAAVAAIEILARVEQSEGHAALALAFAFARDDTPRREGSLGRGSTTMSRAATMINRRTADSAGRNTPSTSR